MDVAALVRILVPCLPFLLGLGQKAVEKSAEKLGEIGGEKMLPLAKKLWEKLHPKVQAKAAAQEAVADVAQQPEDGDAIAALRNQLKKILEDPENASLAAEVAGILAEAEAIQAGGSKFNVQVKDSNVGAIGDHANVNMNFGPKP